MSIKVQSRRVHLPPTEAKRPDAVIHTCNPSYLEGTDWADDGSSPVQVKTFARPPSQSMRGHRGICLSFQLGGEK
jgi:hypothetical protein